MKNKNFTVLGFFLLAIVLLTSFLFSSILTSKISIFAATECSAKAMAVLEVESGRVLFSKNMSEKLAMASTTKIMTALVTIENTSDLEKEIVVSDESIGIEGTSIYLKQGEKIKIKDLLYGLMLASGNDSAVALACSVGGSQQNFVKMMNEKAVEIGAKNTHFANPHGLDAEGHFTTAYDLALITAYALKNDKFKELFGTQRAKIKGSKQGEFRYLKNKNRLIFNTDFCDGGKTGFTDNAGRCLVCSATKNGMQLVSVVLNCGPMFEETEKILNKAFKTFRMKEILSPYCECGDVLINNGEKAFVKTLTKKSFSYPLTKLEEKQVKVSRVFDENIEAPVQKEQEVGKTEIYLDNHLLFSEKIYTMEEIKSVKFFNKVSEILKKWNI